MVKSSFALSSLRSGRVKGFRTCQLAFLGYWVNLSDKPWTSLYTLYTLGGLWCQGSLCAPRLPLDSFSGLNALRTSPIVGKNREAENDEILVAENQRPTDGIANLRKFEHLTGNSPLRNSTKNSTDSPTLFPSQWSKSLIRISKN